MGKIKMHTRFWLINLKGRIRFERGVNRTIIFKWILKRQGVTIWSGFIWLRIGISGGIL
jgi:hypothetical protein